MGQVNPELELVRDFVNTLDVESGTDSLDGWLRTRGLWRPRTSRRDLEQARAVREALRDLLRANNGCESDPDASAAVLDAAARASGVTVSFAGDAVRLVAPEGGIGPVLAAAGQAILEGSWPRLKACRADTCRWAFVDSARNRSRQWCSMQVCGNREKARTFRKRQRRA
ncbi:MAG TPA: CGNR zinc finger domain-containing protein [Gaiellaceae bacterium]|nr:CGNR zinc finger domain-containing protein [Gaiellaceae bacterium]